MKFLLMFPRIDELGGGERVIANFGSNLNKVDVIAFTAKNCITKEEFKKRINEKFKISLNINLYTCKELPFPKLIKSKYKEYIAFKHFIKEIKSYEVGVTHLSDIYSSINKTNKKIIYFVGPGPKLKLPLFLELVKKIYLFPSRFIQAKHVKDNIIIVPVSTHIKKCLEKRGIRTYEVIYPPINVRDFAWKGEKKKKNRIIYFSRISRDKRQHLIIPLAKKLPEYEFIIAGSISDKRYLEEIKKNKTKNIKIFTNLSLKKLTKIVKSSNIYVHLAENDTLPGTVIEAMSAGCIPIVHKSGGAWLDIVEKGRYGYGWDTIEDLAKKIKKLRITKKMRMQVIRKSKEFSRSNFNKKVNKILRELL